MPLSDLDRAVLDVERTWWTQPRTKGAVIRERLDVSPGRYYRLLNDLLDRAEAFEYDPLVVLRTRRMRDLRRRARFERRSAGGRPVR